MFAGSGRVDEAPTGTNQLKRRMLRQHFSPGHTVRPPGVSLRVTQNHESELSVK